MADMSQGGMRSFFRFLFGFTVFISISFGLTYAVASYSVAQERDRQVSAAFQVFLGKDKDEGFLARFPLLDKLGF